jgi:hypothetical protein
MRKLTSMMMVAAACGGGGGSSDGMPVDGRPGADASADAAPPGAKLGRVQILESTVAQTTVTAETAGFFELAPAQERVDGACVITTGMVGAGASAGTITLRSPAGEVSLEPDGAGAYQGMVTPGMKYAAGTPLAISAGGAAVPSWGVAGLTFPTQIALDPPPPLSKSGYALAWSGASRVRVVIAQTGAGVTIVCDYTGVTSAAIPASALSDLVPGTTNDKQIGVMIGAADINRLTAGTYAVELVALDAAYTTVTFVQ